MCTKLMLLVILFVLVLGTAGTAFPATVLQYSFDGTSGGDIPGGLVDDTGTYTATIITGSDADSTIRYADPNPSYNPAGTSADFYNDNWGNNAGDAFLVPDAGGIDFSSFDALTVEFFIYPSSSGSGNVRRIFSEYIYAYMYLDSSNTLHAVRKWGGGNWDENWTHLMMTNFPHDSWSHVAMSWDANGAGDKLKLYVNGELAVSDAGTSTATMDSTAGFAIGGYQREDGSTAQFFVGKIDEFRLCDAALGPSEFLGAAPSILFEAASSDAPESLGEAVLAVTLNNPREGQTYTVDYAVAGGTATNGEDYTLEPDTLVFGPGQTTKTIIIDIIDDDLNEEDETIVVELLNPTGADVQLGAITHHTCTIVDSRPDVEFAAAASSGMEDAGTADIAVKLSHAWTETVTVQYAVTGGTATGGVDYTLEAGTLTFNPGVTTQTIRIDIVNDTITEGAETIELTLSNPTNAKLGTNTHHSFAIIDFRFTRRDPGEFLTDPHRPVIVDGSLYPAVNIRVNNDGVIYGYIARLDGRTYGPIDGAFPEQAVLALTPLDVTAGRLEKLIPDGSPPGPGRYEFRLIRQGSGYPDYQRVLPFTVIESSQANKGVRIGADGSCYRDGRLWLPMIIYVNSRVGSYVDPALRDRFLNYFEGTPFGMMDYANPRAGLSYTVDYVNRCAQRGIPMSMHAAPSVIDTGFAMQLANALRDNPALVFYYINDELGDDWYDALRAMQTTLLKYDPFHPTHCQHYNLEHSIDQADCYDIYVHQFYTGGDRQIRQIFGHIAEMADTVPEPIPYWGNMLLHDSKLRTICYGCLANGAKGLMFYAFHRMWEKYDLATFNQKWDNIVNMGEELQSRGHILLQPLAAAQATINVDEVAIRTVNGNFGKWILIANAYWRTRDATIYLNQDATSARGADGTNYPVTNNRFNLSVTPEDVWLIRLFNDNEQSPASIQLSAKTNLDVVFEAADILAGGSPWQWTGSGTTAEQVVSYPKPDIIRVDTGPSQRACWANDNSNSFGAVDDFTGFTAEIRMKVSKNTVSTRGVDFELYVGSGSLPGKRYLMTVTTAGLYWYEGGTFKPIATGLDNWSQMHTYRMAIRNDGLAQIYRDAELLGVRIADFSLDALVAADGPYLQFGDGTASGEVDFDVEFVAFDLSGPYDRQPCIVGFDDLGKFSQQWLEVGPNLEADLDHNDAVNLTDYSILAENWLNYCPFDWPWN